MSTKAALETVWHGPDDLWRRIAPILGPEKAPGTRRRPAVPVRQTSDAIIYVLRGGCQRLALPREGIHMLGSLRLTRLGEPGRPA